MTKIVLLLAVFICCNTGGEITLTYAMKQVGEPERLRPAALLRFLGRAFRSGWFWLALPLCAASFYSLLVLLSWAPLSVVIPASAATYVVGTFGAKYILNEHVSPKRWMGVLMVCIGVALVLITG
jgi:drug/metabolite transporter (DMT)-like permease